mmetsp:Transcript_32428/g.49612  ORF Transcript_32428/g.49612 Transcript_32428/m.49612 type:complete len:114 (-) Transcript_32428:1462-1803(-)
MQDAIERKIEKFSSQNFNVQKRVNTSSKFRNNSHMTMGNLAPQQVGQQHGPGTSGSQGASMGGISKKKYGYMGENSFNNEQQLFSGNGPLSHLSPPVSLRNQQMKRPNTIANK